MVGWDPIRWAVAWLVAIGALATVAAGAAAAPIHATEGAPFSGQVVTGCTTTAPPTIAWGDGKTSSGTIGGGGAVIGAHGYAEEGSYAGTVSGCASGSESFTILVADAALSASPAHRLGAIARTPLTATLATFADADPGGQAADYTANISWGDGRQSAGVVRVSGGGFAVSATHTYSTAGTFKAKVTIADGGGSRASATTTVDVASKARPPTAAFTLPPGPVKAGGMALFDAASSRSGGTQVSSFTWTVHGRGVDGGTASVTCDGDTSELQTSFSQIGTESVTLRLTDLSGRVTSATHTLAVTGRRLKARTGRHVSQFFLCQRGLSDAAVTATLNGGPPTGCQDQLEYYSQLVDAVGCFTVVYSLGDVPGPEYDILCPHVSPGNCALVLGNGGIIAPASLASASRASSTATAATTEPQPPPAVVAISTSEARINGLDVTPAPGSAIVLDIYGDYLVSSDATVSLLGGQLTVHQGRLDTPTYNVNGDIPLLDKDLDALEGTVPAIHKLFDLAGFQVAGTLTVDLVKHASAIGAAITLPSSFKGVTGKTLTSQVTATADNRNGLVLDHLFVSVPAAKFGGFELDNLSFCYQQHIDALYQGKPGFCQQQQGVDFGSFDPTDDPSWSATGSVNILGLGLNASPPPPIYGLGFVGSSGNLGPLQFDFGGASLGLPPPGLPIGNTGIYLSQVGAAFAVDPVRMFATATLSTTGQLLSVQGELFMVFASSVQPYTFTGSELQNIIVPLPTVTAEGFALAAGGSVMAKLPIPIVGTQTLNLANGWMMYVYPGYLAAAGDIHFDPFSGLLVVDGNIEGQFDVLKGQFDIEGNESVKTPLFSVGASTVFSSSGIGACGSVTVNYLVGQATLQAGAGYRWGNATPDFWLGVGTCDLGPYKTQISPARDAGAALTVRLGAGLPSEMIKLLGSGGAPDITITGPAGIKASTAGGGHLFPKPFAIFRVERQDVTYISIVHPPAGRYTITTNPGSAPITAVLHADAISPAVTGRVIRRKTRFSVAYDVRPEPGQRVIFTERAGRVYRVIGSTTAGHGTLAFTPAPGPGGRREIIAQIAENGTPVVLHPGRAGAGAYETVLASFNAPGPRRLAAVTHIRVRHRSTRVLVSFAGVPGARRYAVIVTLSSGLRLDFIVRRGRLVIPRVFGEMTGRVTIEALGDDDATRTGPAASAPILHDSQW
jgi:hypothetical protein